MCSCETSFGSIFLFEIGASVDGAPVVVRKKRTVTALAQTLTSVAKTIPQMCLTWRNLTKRTLTSVLSPKMWTHERWNGMAQLTKTKRYLALTYLAG